jgi:PAS domain S-box-containing protein
MVVLSLQEMTGLEQAILSKPLLVSLDTSVTEAILLMSTARAKYVSEQDIDIDLDQSLLSADVSSCVLVVNETKLLGIFTLRDVVRLRAKGYQLTQTSIADVMSQPVITLRQSEFTDIFTALSLLKHYHIRHLPIVDDNDQIVGLMTYTSIRQMLHPVDLLRSRLVSEVMNTDVICAVPETSILELTQLMTQHQVSSVVIVAADDPTHAVGIVTETDIVQFHALDLSFANIKAWEVMSSPLFTLTSDHSLWRARSLMQEKCLSRVVVTDHEGKLLGIVTQSHLLHSLNPEELYKFLEILEQKVSSLEKEKLDLLENRNLQLEQEIQKRTEELRQIAEKEKLLSSITSRIRSSIDLQQTLDVIVQEVRLFLQCDRVFIYQFNPDWSGMIVAESLISNHESFLNQVIRDHCFAPDWIEPYNNGRIRVVADIYQANLDPCYIQLLEQIQTRAKILVPIVQEGQIWGLLSATQKDHPRNWQESEINLLEQLATQIAIAIQQANIHQKLQLELAERQRTEEALRQSEKRYASLAAAAPVGIYRTDAQGNCIYVNERWCQIAGLSFHQAMGRGWMNALYPEDREKVTQEWYAAAENNQTFALEYRFQTPNSIVTWVFGQAVAERGEDEQIIGYVGTITDISQRKQSELALQEREQLLSSIAENIVDGYAYRAIIQADGTIEIPYISASAKKLFGEFQTSLSWQQIYSWILPEDREHSQQEIQAAINCLGKLDNEYRIRDIRGQIRWINSRGQVRAREDGCVVIEGVALDITERKQAQADIQALVVGAAAVTGEDFFSLIVHYIADFLGVHCAMIVTTNGDNFQTAAFWANGKIQPNISGFLPGMPCFLTMTQGQFCCPRNLLQNFPNQMFAELVMESYVGVAIQSAQGKTLGSLCLLDNQPLADGERMIAILQVFAARVGAELERQQAMTALEQLNQELEIGVEERTAELQESQERWELAMRGTNDGIWDWNLRTNQVFYSTRWKQMRGFAEDEIGSDLHEWSNLIHSDDYDRVMAALADHLAHKTPFFQEEYRVQRKDGSYIWVLDRRQALWDHKGHVLRVVGSESDITSRKQAEAELLAITNLQQAIFNGIDYSIIFTNPEGIIQSFNAAAERMLGYSAKEVIGKVSPLIFHDQKELEKQAATISEIWGRKISPGMGVFITEAIQGMPNEQEWTYLRQDGFRFPVLLSVTTIYDHQQQIVGFVGIGKDITATKQAEQKLRRTIKELSDFKYALDQAAIVAITDSQGVITYANEKFSEISQYPQSELIGQTHKIVNSGYHSRQFFAELWSTISLGHVWRGEIQNRRQDGSVYWVDSTIVPFLDDQRQPVQYLAICTDITDRREAEKKLKHQLAVIEAAVDGIAILENNILTYVNQALLQLFGYENSAELLGKNWQESLYSEEESLRFEQEVFPVLMQQYHWQGEAIATRKNGTTFHEGLSLTLTEGGALICVCRDISDIKKAEQELRKINECLNLTNAELQRATRLKDEFLANMSHELRTPLNAILGMSEGLQEEIFGEINPRQQKAIATIETSGRHLLELINDILDLSKVESGKLELQLSSVPIKDLIESTLPFVRQQAIRKNINLTVNLPDNLGSIFVDELRISQVLINLLNNAIKFTPDGGNVHLEAYLEAANLVISVIDNGIGIASEDMGKLFQPFVQIDSKLNRQYNGSGLGLSLVRRLIEMHNGQVFLTSEVGKGSCFTVKLPHQQFHQVSYQIHQPKTTNLEPSSSQEKLPTSQKAPLILIVEDNEANIDTVSNYLESRGYSLMVAKNGQEAIEFTKNRRPNLILMDIQMPQIDGLEATRLIRDDQDCTNIPIIALTGLAMPGDRERCLQAGANEYLSKPVRLKQLAEMIETLLNQ